jgi:hypothetical protein
MNKQLHGAVMNLFGFITGVSMVMSAHSELLANAITFGLIAATSFVAAQVLLRQ